MEGGVDANTGEERASLEGQEGEEKSPFFVVGDGFLVWLERRGESA